MNQAKESQFARILSYATAVILVLLPFHALFTTWLASGFGHADLFKIWKELLLVPLGIAALCLGLKDAKTRAWLQKSKLFYLIAAYILLQIALGALAVARHDVNANALIYGLLDNTQFLVFFVVCFLLASQSPWLKNNWRPLLLWPAVTVICFALLQLLVLPADFLRHFGYGPHAIPAYQTVDLKQQYIRLQSTLRGPNPLGAYLVLVTSAFAALFFKDKRARKYWAFLLGAGSVILFFTYSRSAIAGTAIALFIIVWRLLKSPAARQRLLAAAGVLAVVGVGLVLGLRHNDIIQNTLFHTDEHSRSIQSSNQQRTSHLEQAVQDIEHEPLGRGPGTAGPASARNNHPARIAENYYLQIGQEAGILGMMLFVAINVLVAVKLWRTKGVFALILFASLIGISLVNFVSHAWADDTLALLWWGFAGIALGSVILKANSEQK